MPDEVSVDVYVPHRAPLSGSELKEFLAEEEEERRAKKEEAERKAMMREIELARGRLRLGGDEEGGTTGGGGAGKTGGVASNNAASSKPSSGKTAATTSAATSSRPKKKSRFDQNLFIKFSKPVHSECMMCPFSASTFLHRGCRSLRTNCNTTVLFYLTPISHTHISSCSYLPLIRKQ